MVRTSSTMLPLGSEMPNFDLEVVNGTNLSINTEGQDQGRINSKALENKPVLIMVLCAHCPFVKHIELGLTQLEKDYASRLSMIAVSSNSLITHPQDGPDNLAAQANACGWTFPYLLDSDQSFAKALKAACTPDFFLFAPSLKGIQKLEYRGQLDDSRPGNEIPVSGKDLRVALDAIFSGKKLSPEQKPSIGCNIKWHPGKEPSWFG